jgi:hypothetical protein
MSLSRAVSWASLCCAVLVVAASCSSQKDTEAYVPSERGAVQPDSGGPLLAEGPACDRLKSAESSARATLGCPAVTRECPAYIRPAGIADCFLYSQDSIDSCSALYDSFKDCADFDKHPCLISAVDNCTFSDAGVPGDGGAGGAASTPSEAGTGGALSESTAGAGGA